jgi:hypothetical protein
MNFYETYMGRGGAYFNRYSNYSPSPAFAHINRSGQLILDEIGGVVSYSDYINVVLRYPLEVAGSYVRHLVAMLNPIEGGGVVYYRSNLRFIFTLFNFTLLFIVFNFLKRNFFDCSFDEQKMRAKSLSLSAKMELASIVTILLPFAAIIPGAVEERFGIGFWIIMYGLVCYCINLKEEIKTYKQRPLKFAIYYVIVFAFFIGMLTEIYANNSHVQLLPILNLF